jgi:chitin synthase
MQLIYQKYIIIFLLLCINTSLISTLIIYENKWYIFIFFLALASIINTFRSLLLLFNKLCNTDNNYDIKRSIDPKNYIYLVPCYNESEEELTNTFNSIIDQRTVKKDKRAMMIICDGKVTGYGNNLSTDKILLNIFNKYNYKNNFSYTTRENEINIVDLYMGEYKNIDYILIIKHKNYGKRDSIVLARRLIYNNININLISFEFFYTITLKFNKIFNNKIDYIINVDADTVFDFDCTYELIKGIDKRDVVGCVGIVDINLSKTCLFNPFILYQYAEYMFAQCLQRQAQSNLTHKVTCLSGCVQILKVCEENCGELILEKYNYCPTENDNIFTKIRSIASEDRNHICIMQSLYPYVKTEQNLKAICYTNVPLSLRVLLSQRRRWTLGATTNDLLLLFSKNINIFERIAASVNILTFSLLPFIIVATSLFIKNIIINPSYLMLYLSILMIIPFGYGLLIPIFIKRMNFIKSIYFYLSYIFFLSFGFMANIIIYFYSLFTIDTITWGKTRRIEKNTYNLDWDNYDMLTFNTNSKETDV